MSIEVACQCGKTLKAKDEHAGLRAKGRTLGANFVFCFSAGSRKQKTKFDTKSSPSLTPSPPVAAIGAQNKKV
jgi:hypothetical protein